MNRFLLMSATLLLPSSCISVNTASQTLDAGTVYRTWILDDHAEAYLKNGSVFINVTQCEQRQDTPVIGSPMAQIGTGSHMENIPGTKKTVYLQSPWKEDKKHPLTVSPVQFMNSGETTVAERFNPTGARNLKILSDPPTIRSTFTSDKVKKEVIMAPSMGRKIVAGFQSCMIDAPGTVIANILLIPAAIVAAPCKGLYHLCSGE